MNFDAAFELLLSHEGGYSNSPNDPGGETMFGITASVARANGYTGAMQDLPRELAKQIAKKQYWESVRASDLPIVIRYPMFDSAYHSGVPQATRWLQRALGVKDDGVIGPVTLAAAHQADAQRLKSALLAQRLRFMAGLSNWPAFSRGWSRRIADLMEA